MSMRNGHEHAKSKGNQWRNLGLSAVLPRVLRAGHLQVWPRKPGWAAVAETGPREWEVAGDPCSGWGSACQQ